MPSGSAIAANSDLLTPVLNSVVRVGVHMSVVRAPETVWSNEYFLAYTGVVGNGATEPAPIDFDALASAFVNFHQPLMLNSYQINSVGFGTYTKDSHPYNPNTQKSVDFAGGLVGTRSTPASDPSPLETAYRVDRQAAVGKDGRLFLRGLLEESDVTAPSGRITVNDPSTFAGIIQTALDNAPAPLPGQSSLKLREFLYTASFPGVNNNIYGYYLCTTSRLTISGVKTDWYRLQTNYVGHNATIAKLTRRTPKPPR